MTRVDRLVGDPLALGAAVREARAERRWTQAQLAEHAGVSRSFVLALERGARPRAELMRVLAVLRALGKSIRLVDQELPAFDEVLDEVLR